MNYDSNRFYDDIFLRDMILDKSIQNDLISKWNICEIKKISLMIEQIISSEKKAKKLPESDLVNICDFFDILNKTIIELIEETRWKVVNALDLKFYHLLENKTFLNGDFYWSVENIELFKNVNVCINNDHKTLLIYTLDWDLIWEIWQSNYDDWFFRTEQHLYNVVEKKYRWNWWGIVLYELYTKLAELDQSFILPNFDYTNVVSMVELYKKFWFKIKSKLFLWFDEELSQADYLEMEAIKKEYKSWRIERKLPYSVMISK